MTTLETLLLKSLEESEATIKELYADQGTASANLAAMEYFKTSAGERLTRITNLEEERWGLEEDLRRANAEIKRLNIFLRH